MQATAAGTAAAKEKKKKKLPRLEEFIQSRDFAGAITLLEVCSTPKECVFDGNHGNRHPSNVAIIAIALVWPQ